MGTNMKLPRIELFDQIEDRHLLLRIRSVRIRISVSQFQIQNREIRANSSRFFPQLSHESYPFGKFRADSRNADWFMSSIRE